MSETTTITEVDILADVIQPESPDLSLDAAREILTWKFRDAAVARMNELADRNNQGLLTNAERDELHKYLRVGNLINLLQAKARLALKQTEDQRLQWAARFGEAFSIP